MKLQLSILLLLIVFASCKKQSNTSASTNATATTTTTTPTPTTAITSTVGIDILLAVPTASNMLLTNYDTSNVKVFLKSSLSLSLTPIPISITSTTNYFRNDRFAGSCVMTSNDSVVIIFDSLLYKSANNLVAKATVGSNTHNIYNYTVGTFIGNYSMSNAPTFGGGLVAWTTGTYQRVAYVK